MTLRRRWIPMGVLVLFTACATKSEDVASEIATVVCDGYASCDCESALQDAAACNDAVVPGFAEAIEESKTAGLRYQSACLGNARKYVAALGCKTEAEVDGDEELAALRYDARACKLFVGDILAGEACTRVSGPLPFPLVGDSCGADLVCSDDEVCVALPAAAGDDCGLDRPCPGELVCDALAMKCVELPGVGQPCPAGVCKEGTACDGLVCQPSIGVGESCEMMPFCAKGLYCANDTCEPLPGKDELCAEGACAPGLLCGGEDRCTDAPAFSCALPQAVGSCLFRFNSICDESVGTGLCEDGTDPEDCAGMGCGTQFDGVCDEPGGGGTDMCPVGTDAVDCAIPDTSSSSGTTGDTDSTTTMDTGSSTGDHECPFYNDGDCDEPEGTNLCPEGTDPIDCA